MTDNKTIDDILVKLDQLQTLIDQPTALEQIIVKAVATALEKIQTQITDLRSKYTQLRQELLEKPPIIIFDHDPPPLTRKNSNLVPPVPPRLSPPTGPPKLPDPDGYRLGSLRDDLLEELNRLKKIMRLSTE